MNHFLFVVTLFPVVFMFHDFEEIIFLKSWYNKNKQWLSLKYHFIPNRLFVHLENISTTNFALMVAEEFILVSVITYLSILVNNFYFWLGLFMAFSVHIVVHIIQWIVVRRYIPAIATSLVCLPYCFYTMLEVVNTNKFTVAEILLCTIGGVIAVSINLMLIHKICSRL